MLGMERFVQVLRPLPSDLCNLAAVSGTTLGRLGTAHDEVGDEYPETSTQTT